jgi:hypothetical protein
MKRTIKLTESDLAKLVNRIINEMDYTVEPEISTMPREEDIKSIFGGKYDKYIPQDVFRYLRKSPAHLFRRLYKIYGDKAYEYLDMAKRGGTDKED